MKPIYAEGTKNTFLIFDYIDEGEVDVDYVRYTQCNFPSLIDSSLVIEKKDSSNHELIITMRVYEPGDGFCGNGARVMAKYLKNKYKEKFSKFFIESEGYLHEIFMTSYGECFVEMGQTIYLDETNQFYKGHDKVLSISSQSNEEVDFYYTQTSEPHLISFSSVLSCIEAFLAIGKKAQSMKSLFPRGVNLNYVQVLNEKELKIKTFERGIERFTMACGSGSVSAVALCLKLGLLKGQLISVHVDGGVLHVKLEEGKVFLGGQVSVINGYGD